MRRSILAVLLLALVSACSETTSPTAVSVAGTFNLVSVNGSPLPWTGTNDAQFKYEVIQDTFTLTDSRTWTETFRYRFTDKAADTSAVNELNDSGIYDRSGSNIHLSSVDTDMSGSYDGSSLRFVLPNSVELIYRR